MKIILLFEYGIILNRCKEFYEFSSDKDLEMFLNDEGHKTYVDIKVLGCYRVSSMINLKPVNVVKKYRLIN